jgi:hypothetical protein
MPTADDRRQKWLKLLLEERSRRGVAAGTIQDPRERLIAELDLMAERLRAAPDWVEPTPEEQERNRQELNRWFRERGYDIEL